MGGLAQSRMASRDQANLVEAQSLAHLHREPEMPAVHRIECPAKNPDGGH